MKYTERILLTIPFRRGYSAITIDLGLLYLYSAAKDRGLDAAILHCPKEGVDEDGWTQLMRSNPQLEIIALKAYTMDHFAVKRMAEIAKRELPGCTVIVGGPHASGVPELVLRDMPAVDYAFKGEGERGFPRFCEAVLAGQSVDDIPGLAWRTPQGLHLNPPELIEDLDTLPRIRWEDIPIHEYPDYITSLPFIPVMATRGCPYQCTYCSAFNIFGRRFRHRSVQSVVDELRLLQRVHGVRAVNFSDNEFSLDRGYVMELCQALKDSGLGTEWELANGLRLDTVDEELLSTMADAGCRYVSIGVESASNSILLENKKAMTQAVIREKAALVLRSGLQVQGLFIIGFPTETQAQILDTIRFSLELGIDKTNFSILMPLPGTEVFDSLVASGAIDVESFDWENMRPDNVTFPREHLSASRLRWLQRYAYLRFYLRPRPLRRLSREFLFRSSGRAALTRKVRSVLSS